jgi:hypothetical protein
LNLRSERKHNFMDVSRVDSKSSILEPHGRLFDCYKLLNADALSMLRAERFTFDGYMESYISRFRFCDPEWIQ